MRLRTITRKYWRLIMQVEISKQEAWKIMDAINSYIKDYALNGSVEKTFNNIITKLKKITND